MSLDQPTLSRARRPASTLTLVLIKGQRTVINFLRLKTSKPISDNTNFIVYCKLINFLCQLKYEIFQFHNIN